MTSMVLIRCCNNPYRVDIDVRTHEKRFNLPDSGGDIVVGYTFSSRLCCMLFVHVFFKLPESYYWWNTQNIVCVVFVPFVFFLFVAHFVRRKILNDFFDLPHLHSRFAALSHNRLHIYTQTLTVCTCLQSLAARQQHEHDNVWLVFHNCRSTKICAARIVVSSDNLLRFIPISTLICTPIATWIDFVHTCMHTVSTCHQFHHKIHSEIGRHRDFLVYRQ